VGTPLDAVEPFAVAEQAAEELVLRLGARPEVALVLGSGWRTAAEALGVDQFAIYLMHDQKEQTLRAYARELLPALAR